MCITIPALILEIKDGQALLATAQGEVYAESAHMPGLKVGDRVAHIDGLITSKLCAGDAAEILSLMEVSPPPPAESVSVEIKNALKACKGGLAEINDITALLKAQGADKLALFNEATMARRRKAEDFVSLIGVIEFSNFCTYDCAYCGYGMWNRSVERYRMEANEIVRTAVKAVKDGYKLLILQCGEDPFYSDDQLVRVIEDIKSQCRVFIFLSIGERGYDSYKRLKEAGAAGLFFRFETSEPERFNELHPDGKELNKRLEHLGFFRDLGYFVATGSVIGLPEQGTHNIAKDILKTAESADMVTIGPFIPTPGTELALAPKADMELCLRAVAIIRLITSSSRIRPVVISLAPITGASEIKAALSAGSNSLIFNLTPEKYLSPCTIYPDRIDHNGSIWQRCGLLDDAFIYKAIEEKMKIKIN